MSAAQMSGVLPVSGHTASSSGALMTASALVSPAAAATCDGPRGSGGGLPVWISGSFNGEEMSYDSHTRRAISTRLSTTYSAPSVVPPSVLRRPVSSNAVRTPAALPKRMSLAGESPTISSA
eukprot:scaffold592_cov124-Isochrysis_galbana.AAC.2